MGGAGGRKIETERVQIVPADYRFAGDANPTIEPSFISEVDKSTSNVRGMSVTASGYMSSCIVVVPYPWRRRGKSRGSR